MSIAIFILAAITGEASGPDLNDDQVRERLQFLEQRFAAGAPNAKLWFGVWTAAYSGLAVGQGALAIAVSDREKRVGYIVGGSASLLGALAMVALPMPAAFASGRLEAMPESTAEERRQKLAAAERWLDRAADGEAFGRSWLQEVGSVMVTVTLGLVLALGYHYYPESAIDTFGGLVVSQMQIITQPVQAIHDREEYARRFGVAIPDPPPVTFHFGLFPGGLSVLGRF